MPKLVDKLNEATSLHADMARGREQRKLSSMSAKYDEACDHIADLERQVAALTAVGGNIAAKRYDRLRKGKVSGTTATIVCSDWHYEERVDPKTVGGLNDYSIEEADRRISRLWQKSVELIDFCRHLAPINSVVVALLGDFMTGYIHEELMEGNQLSPTETCLVLQERILGGLEFIHRETKLPIRVVTSIGNHGRTTLKRRIATAAANSYEWMMYKTLEKRCIEKKMPVTWQIGNGYHNIMEIEGHRVCFHHGDAVRYAGGVGGISIPINKAVAQWNKANHCALYVQGHYHQFLSHFPTWLSNGCLIGYAPFSVEIKADYQRPTQSLFVLDREQGLTVPAIPIFVT